MDIMRDSEALVAGSIPARRAIENWAGMAELVDAPVSGAGSE